MSSASSSTYKRRGLVAIEGILWVLTRGHGSGVAITISIVEGGGLEPPSSSPSSKVHVPPFNWSSSGEGELRGDETLGFWPPEVRWWMHWQH